MVIIFWIMIIWLFIGVLGGALFNHILSETDLMREDIEKQYKEGKISQQEYDELMVKYKELDEELNGLQGDELKGYIFIAIVLAWPFILIRFLMIKITGN